MSIKQDRGQWFSVTATGVGSATASLTGTLNGIYYITDVGASTGSQSAFVGSLVVLTETATKSNLWLAQLAGGTSYEKNFNTPLVGAVGGTVTVTTTGTYASYANMSGFIIYKAQ